MDEERTRITIFVGGDENRASWSVPKKLLVESSGYFRRVLGKQSKMSRSNVVIIRDQNPEIFTLFVRWLTSSKPLIDTDAWSDHTKKHDPVMKYAQAWVLGESLDCLGLQNHCITQICHIHVTPEDLKPEFIQYVFTNTSPSSKLRQYAARTTYYFFYQNVWRRDLDQTWSDIIHGTIDLHAEIRRLSLALENQPPLHPSVKIADYFQALPESEIQPEFIGDNLIAL